MSRPDRQPTAVDDSDSRLGALGVGEDTRLDMLSDALSDFGPGWRESSHTGGEADAAPGGRIAEAGARLRVLRTYVAARAMLGVALVLAQAVGYWLVGRQNWPMAALSVAYVAQALISWWWTRQPRRTRALQHGSRRLWWATIGWDLLTFSAMHWVDPAGSLNHAALLVLPVMVSGVLSPRTPALATAAAVALMLLATAVQNSLLGGDLVSLLSQAGLAGIGLFVIVLVSGEMASRLARQERSARTNLALALQQAELNRLVIDEMSDGVLVVDRRGGVRAANPAARGLLAEDNRCPAPPFSLQGQPGWRPLLDAIEAAYAAGHWPASGMDLTVSHGGEAPRSVRVRARFTRRARVGAAAGDAPRDEVLGVLFVEELRNVLARQRQERLVAMGRISAGIAHEIRNPLAAISQANALLQEDVLRPDQQRLVRIVSDNTQRLKRIVDDVMEAAPGSGPPSRVIDLSGELAAICSEWARTVGLSLGTDSRLQISLPAEPLGAVFDDDHLRRVLVNLLENALRHATGQPGAVRLSVEPLAAHLVRLRVASDGDPVAPEVEAHLFEPFHSTRSRGTGLGLYICRELCERHGASIDYLRHGGERHVNVFQVVMRREAIDTPGRLHL